MIIMALIIMAKDIPNLEQCFPTSVSFSKQARSSIHTGVLLVFLSAFKAPPLMVVSGSFCTSWFLFLRSSCKSVSCLRSCKEKWNQNDTRFCVHYKARLEIDQSDAQWHNKYGWVAIWIKVSSFKCWIKMKLLFNLLVWTKKALQNTVH